MIGVKTRPAVAEMKTDGLMSAVVEGHGAVAIKNEPPSPSSIWPVVDFVAVFVDAFGDAKTPQWLIGAARDMIVIALDDWHNR